MISFDVESELHGKGLCAIGVDEAGRGALAGVAPETPIRWVVDPAGPECADAEDNALGGVVCAGEVFPTDHVCAPAHAGCRCMILPAD